MELICHHPGCEAKFTIGDACDAAFTANAHQHQYHLDAVITGTNFVLVPEDPADPTENLLVANGQVADITAGAGHGEEETEIVVILQRPPGQFQLFESYPILEPVPTLTVI
jgi:hypothetical protein